MKKLTITNAKFLKSATTLAEYPKINLPEYAIIGRSNVGKSSLINSITGVKNLAITSSSPGRTRLINFFNIDNRIIITDLPGYGYIKGNVISRNKITKIINEYFEKSTFFRAVLLLLDIRREPSSMDIQLLQWLKDNKTKYHLVLTKSDKLSRNAQKKSITKICHLLGENRQNVVLFSKNDSNLRKILITKIFGQS